MRKYGFSNGNGHSLDYDLKFLSFPTFSYGQEVTEEKSIPGKTGTIISRTGSYKDTVISNPLEFESESLAKFHTKENTVREWLLSSKKLVYSDREQEFFIVKKVEVGEVKRKYGVYGEFTVIFTCKPGIYLIDGQEEKNLDELYNAHSWSEPVYKITGNGPCTLTVNGKTMTATVTDDIIIDTERMITYDSSGNPKNTSVSGDYEDLYLQPGENTVTVSSGFTCTVIPNWRCL